MSNLFNFLGKLGGKVINTIHIGTITKCKCLRCKEWTDHRGISIVNCVRALDAAGKEKGEQLVGGVSPEVGSLSAEVFRVYLGTLMDIYPFFIPLIFGNPHVCLTCNLIRFEGGALSKSESERYYRENVVYVN